MLFSLLGSKKKKKKKKLARLKNRKGSPSKNQGMKKKGRLKTQKGNLRNRRAKKKERESVRACQVENLKGWPRQKLREIK